MKDPIGEEAGSVRGERPGGARDERSQGGRERRSGRGSPPQERRATVRRDALPERSRTTTLSRRDFVRLAAAGSAAIFAAPAAALAAEATKRKKPAGASASAPSPALATEIKRQKDQLAQTLKTLRDYPLPPGSNPAFVLKPMKPARSRKSR